MDMMFTCYSHVFFFFIFISYVPTCFGLCISICTGRRVEESCTCICFCVCVSSEPGDSLPWRTHDCNMIVYHVCRLVIGNVDMFQMSLDLCRCCLDNYVASIMFFDLCLVDGVCWLVSWFWVHQVAGKHHVLWWSTRCDHLLEEKKDFVGIIFSLV